MSPGIIIKYICSLFVIRAIKRKLLHERSKCLVLAYHRVLPKIAVDHWVEPGMYVTPEILRTHIRFLKRYFDIIDVEQLDALIESGRGRKPVCILTFDDGWLDFYKYAWPVLRDEDVPAVVYLPTALIGTQRIFWTDRLVRLLERSDGRKNLAEKFDLVVEKKIEKGIESLKKYPYEYIEKKLATCETEVGISDEGVERSFMNWEESRELYASGLITFGSHTVHHAILTTLSDAEICVELQESKKKLQSEKVVGEKISFCYPNGNYSTEIAEMVKNVGYSSAMTCDPGWNKTGANKFMLKRVSLHQDVSFTEHLFAYRLNQFCA